MKANKKNAKQETTQHILFVGIDWADREHVVCLVADENEPAIETLVHEPEAIADWVDGLNERFPGHRVLVALEQSRGPLFAALAGHEELELYPINPKQLARYREAVVPSGAKDDPADAKLLAEFLVHYRQRLRPWKPDATETRRIVELCELRRKLVEERKRLVLQLASSLKQYFPFVLKLAPGKLSGKLTLDLLRRWPTLEKLRREHPRTLRRFLGEHAMRNELQQTQWIETVRTAVPLTKDKAIVEPRAKYVQALVEQIRDLNRAIVEFDEELRKVVVVHPDYALFSALPGAGAALVPRLIAAFGSDRDRYESAAEMQNKSGIAPVTRKSGKSHVVKRRYACPKFLRQTFHEFASHARRWSAWSKAFYDMKRAAGFKHHAALRALAYKWIRIIFRLWKTNTIYSEKTYQQRLVAKNSPLVKFLKTT